MRCIKEPVVVRPTVYEIPMNLGFWCKLKDVCEIAQNNARLGGVRVEMTIPNLLRRYATLVRPSKGSGKRLFQYSLDGLELRTQEVPPNLPSAEFSLSLHSNVFVREEWARDTLSMIRQGCYEVRRYESNEAVGIREQDGHHYIVRLPKRQ